MKNWMQLLGIIGLLSYLPLATFGQVLTQTIRGTVIDQDNKMPLIGATIAIITIENATGTTTDTDGNFRLENIPVGRQTLQVSYLGYETATLSSLLVSSGKELVLTIQLQESYTTMKEVVVTADNQQNKPLNEMATVSAQQFSVEETQRYAATGYDPGRMIQTFAGVVISGEDTDNEVVIRGNSPRGLLWRLEGIDIPTPTHFANPGSSGGAISMLSSSMLTNSDFYTGAFPAEYGNALAGVFDLKFRNGNNQRREYAVMMGGLGVEAAMEGPFSKNSKASYLINYRYVTLKLVEALVPILEGRVPVYQDLSFKFHFPTQRAGTFNLFGIGGTSQIGRNPELDSSLWEHNFDEIYQTEQQRLGIVGVSHFYPLSSKSYLKTAIVASNDRYFEEAGRVNPTENYRTDFYLNNLFENNNFRGHTMYHHKFNVQHTLRAGLLFSNLNYHLKRDLRNEDTDIWTTDFDNNGSANLFQTYAQWKFRLRENVTFNIGLHYLYLALNNSQSIDPRMALQWQVTDKQSLSLAIGKHSQQQHISTYLVNKLDQNGQSITPNRDLAFSQAIHYILAYDQSLSKGWRLKAEAYYQYLYDVPIEALDTSTFSLLNSSRIWDITNIEQMNNEGTGFNYGLDLTVNKFFSNGFYVLATASLYNSKFRPANGNLYNSRYNGNYLLNLLYGKEWKAGKNKLWGVNGRLVWQGNTRYTETDFVRSAQTGQQEIFQDRFMEAQYPAYFRVDASVRLNINTGKTTHTIMLDFQNLTMYPNILEVEYDEIDNEVFMIYQARLFPFFNYRITF